MSAVVERLINLLAFLLDATRPVTAEEIRRTVPGYSQSSRQAFRRMFERDKDSLRRLGISLELRATDVWDVEKGYVVPDENYRAIDPGFTEEERTALALAVHVVRAGGWSEGPHALHKLGGARLTAPAGPVAADLGLEQSRLSLLFQAVLERRRVSFVYRDRSRIVEPYGMCHRRGRWYFAGSAPGDPTGNRTYRVDRAEGMETTGPAGAFDRPAGFRARDILSSLPWEEGAESQVARVRWAARAAWWARRRFGDAKVVERGEDGSMVLDIPYSVGEHLINILLDMDDSVEVLAPPDLRERLVSLVRGGA